MSMGIKQGPSSVLAGARAGRLPTFFDFKSRPWVLAPSLHHLDWWAQPYVGTSNTSESSCHIEIREICGQHDMCMADAHSMKSHTGLYVG